MSILSRRGCSQRFLVASLLLAPFTILARAHDAQAQVGVLRKARDAARDRALDIETLFGKEPPLTTSIDDARDGVPSLDGFEPESYSPLADMPWGQDGTLLLFPGTYVLMSQGYCLKPGTFGPQTGDGYLYTEWKGPKADLIKRVLQRHAEHRDVPQAQVQLILWAIIARTDMSRLQPETKVAAAKLLTPVEMADLLGYKLGVVPDGVRQRALQSAPAPVRELLEAENEMRRLLTPPTHALCRHGRVAVRTGTVRPATQFIVRAGAGRTTPAAFFIRFLPSTYSNVRVDITTRKSSAPSRCVGRIISISTPDGRRLEPNPPEPATLHAVSHLRANGRSRNEILAAAAWDESSNARSTLLALAELDYRDLLDVQRSMVSSRRISGTMGTSSSRTFIREAVHAALARYIGLRHHVSIPRGSALAQSLRPVWMRSVIMYVVAPVASNEWATVQGSGGGGFQPSSGGGIAPGNRQRQGQSGVPSALPA
jgi:hypothetical protein